MTIQDLSVGNYDYIWSSWGNGTDTHYNNTEISTYTVAQSQEPCQVSFNETSPLTYPDIFLVWTNCSSDFVLAINSTTITNYTAQSLAAGIYNFTVTRNDTQNYSNIYDQQNFTINQVTSIVNMWLDNSQSDLTIFNGTVININGTRTAGKGEIIVYIDGVIFNSGTPPVFNSTNFTNAEAYINFTIIQLATENYTSSFETFWLTVTKLVPPSNTPGPGGNSIIRSPGYIDLSGVEAISNDTWLFGVRNSVVIKATNNSNDLTEITDISITIKEDIIASGGLLVKRDTGYYEVFYTIPQQNISNFTLNILIEQEGKTISVDKNIIMKDSTLSEVILKNVEDRIENFDVWISNYLVLIMIVAIIISLVIFTVAVFLVLDYAKVK